MKRIAANIVYINSIEFYKQHIVELYDHIVVNHYPLQEESPMTEWFCGSIIIHEKAAYLIEKVLSLDEARQVYSILSSSSELSTNNSCCYGHIQRL